MRLLVLAPSLLIAVCHGGLSSGSGPPFPMQLLLRGGAEDGRSLRSSVYRTRRRSRVVAAFLRLPAPHRHPHASLGGAPKQARGRWRNTDNVPSRRVIRLPEKSNKNSDQEPQQQPEEWLEFVDTGLLFADVMAITIACQFMGLMDVLADVDFWKNGGWLQPIHYSGPSTLPILVRRFSLNTVLWVMASLCLGAYNADNSTTTPAAIKANTADPTTQQATNILASALQRSGVYSVLRIVTEVGLSLLIVGGSSENNNPADFSSFDTTLQMLRECYIVSLTAIAARYVFFGIYNR